VLEHVADGGLDVLARLAQPGEDGDGLAVLLAEQGQEQVLDTGSTDASIRI
jgi:hypothetical protein